jgi:hydrogenase maturation protein HypF
MEKLPYDRGNITMRRFPMCSACSKEYSDSGSRRRHAQTISCHECGPQLLITETGKKTDMREQPEDPGDVHDTRLRLQRCVDILMDGGVLAVKGIGGYQLCCRADRPEAVRRIRVLKQREKKPFAVMFADAGQVREYCELSAARGETA